MMKDWIIIGVLMLMASSMVHAQLSTLMEYELDTRLHRELEIPYSEERGFHLPGLKTVQIAGISIPAEGLKLFDKDKGKVVYFNGTRWEVPLIIRLYSSKIEMENDTNIKQGTLAKVENTYYIFEGTSWILRES